jgi:hypothetical protein
MRRWYLVHYDIMNDILLIRGRLWSGSLRLFLYRIGLAKEAFDATAVHSHACDAPPKQMPITPTEQFSKLAELALRTLPTC